MLLAAAELPQYLLLTLTPAFSPSFRNPGLSVLDYGLAGIFVTILVLEMISDNQQQIYQHFKAQAKAGKAGVLSPKDEGRLARGFVTEGLWSFSRHPVRPTLDSSFREPPLKIRSKPRTSRASNRHGGSCTHSLSSPSSLRLPSPLRTSPLPSYPSNQSGTSSNSARTSRVCCGTIPFGPLSPCRCSSTLRLISPRRSLPPNTRTLFLPYLLSTSNNPNRRIGSTTACTRTTNRPSLNFGRPSLSSSRRG